MSKQRDFDPKRIELTESELNALLDRVKTNTLSDSDKKLVENVFRFSVWLQHRLERGKLKIAKLRKLLFGNSSERRKKGREKNDEDKGDSEDAHDEEKNIAEPDQTEERNTLPATVEEQSTSLTVKRRGHGRIAASEYSTANDVVIGHPGLKPGDPCPAGCGGRVYIVEPGVIIRITGSNIAQVTRYHIEKLRCALCGIICSAPLPEGIAQQKYDAKFKAMLVALRYFGGMPLYRQEKFQAMLRFPFPDATQWDLIESVADCVYPVFHCLEKIAANGRLAHNDDTTVKILDVIADNLANPDKTRTGMFTTGVIAYADGHQIALFYSGVKHAGENLEELLQHRSKRLDAIIQMCDALSRNAPKEIKTIACYCLSHGRRQFIDVESFFPEGCGYIIEQLAEVYKHEAHTKAKRLDPEARLHYHKKHSGPVLEALHSWMVKQLEEGLVEPNSGLGEAIRYMLKHWEKLTRFLSVVGAPIDNNVVERALKLAIRFRKNCLFFRSLHSAFIGGLLQSLIYTCYLAKENPVDYLTALQENKSRVFRAASEWLPWNFRDTLSALSEDLARAA